MAQIGNTAAFTVSDGLNNFLNIDTVNKIVQILNGASLKLYSDGGSTQSGQVLNALQSATAPAIANAGTISTSVTVSRLAPAAAVTGIILAAGAYPGQNVVVVNESAVGNTLTFNTTPATANVADSATEAPLDGLQARWFVWDSVQALWYPVGNSLINGTYVSIQSATAPDPGAGGTINTAGVGVARVSPAAARANIVLQAGTYPGQEVTVVNEAAAANTLTFNTTPATAHVADSATEGNIPGLTARSFVYDTSTSLWYRQN